MNWAYTNIIEGYKTECLNAFTQNQSQTGCGFQTFFGARFGVQLLRYPLGMGIRQVNYNKWNTQVSPENFSGSPSSTSSRSI